MDLLKIIRMKQISVNVHSGQKTCSRLSPSTRGLFIKDLTWPFYPFPVTVIDRSFESQIQNYRNDP
jgi:hypothetical protein